ncbi:hypothetical protein jhhlp_001366 [Lomentospora prolificans]|uniref:Anaphase-promoting complex subunit 5 n=1 Tax=Lomentospora prolificans TaxID=41688 RepID=A0A2N3NI11_9PEZI|nr:hypothetical protein jhhlp_001366 [Lomentospora prolificans]
MARYLTPAKMGLLALIELYADEAVTADAILPVLSFITSHLVDTAENSTLPSSSPWQKAERTANLVVDIHEFEKVLSPHPVVLGMPGRRLWDSFLQKLWEINSLNAMHEFFSRLRLLLQLTKEELRHIAEATGRVPEPEGGIRLCKTSIFGIFVRRCQLEFARLRFHDSADLWKSFVRYRQPTAQYLRKKNPSFEKLSFDQVLLVGELEDPDFTRLAAAVYGEGLVGSSSGTFPISTDDLEGLLEFQVEQIQKYGNRVPLEARQKLQEIMQESLITPSVSHYVRFLDSWRAGDLPNAFDYLHRYFDYTMQNHDRLFYQYALMNLAVLQAEFGCYTEAVDAMLQTVSTARENRDITCLNFALNWLFHFGRAHPSLVKHIDPASTLGSSKETLAFLRVRAKETGMWTLWSSVLLSEAKLTLSNGESVATALENVVRSSQVIIERNARVMFGPHLMLLASLWDRLGLSNLSAMTCEVALRAHAPHGVFEDELRLTCKLAMDLAGRGRYNDALRLLDEKLNTDGVVSTAPPPHQVIRAEKTQQYWRKYRGIIKLRRDLARSDLDGASDLLSQLLQSKFDDLEPDMALSIDLLHVDYLPAPLMSPPSRLDERHATTMTARHILYIYHPSAFSLATRAASLSHRARLLPLLWHSAAALATILTSLSEFSASSRLLSAALPRALEYHDALLAATLYSALADAEMGLAGQSSPASRPRTEHLTRAADALDRAFKYYADVEEARAAREVVAKRAAVMKVLGDKALAAQYSAKYVSLLEREDARRKGVQVAGRS